MIETNTNTIYENGEIISFRSFLTKVFSTMSIGIAISAFVAFITYNFLFYVPGFGMFVSISVFAELIVGLVFSFGFMKMSKTGNWICYIIYSILTGMSMAVIVAFFTGESVIFAFLATFVLFVCMSIIGHTTKFDLTKIGTLAIVGLFSILLVSLLNSLIFKSPSIDYIITTVGVIIFLILIAYDIQKLKRIYTQTEYNREFQDKMVIMGAFQLYLDFINLFLRILQIFGRGRGSGEKRSL